MNDFELAKERMVDGELDLASEREFLRACESDNRWRELALAYVENQVLQRELVDMIDQSPQRQPVASLSAGAQRQVRSSESGRWRLLSLAATALICLGLGYWGADGLGRRVPQNQGPAGPTDATLVSNPPRTMPFMIDHPQTSELQQIEIPLFNATDLGSDWQQKIQTNEWEGLVREMRQKGLNLRQERTFTPVRMSDGQRVVVPVDMFYEQPYQ